MSNLLDPKQDYIFKNIFGVEKNKKLLLSLLNAILDGNPHINDLTMRNTEISKILKEDKTTRLDVRARTDTGIEIDIEIQCQNTGEIPTCHQAPVSHLRADRPGDRVLRWFFRAGHRYLSDRSVHASAGHGHGNRLRYRQAGEPVQQYCIPRHPHRGG